MDQQVTRQQTIRITVASGTAANQLREASIALDPAYDKIISIAFHQVADGGTPLNYQVGARNTRQQWIDPVNVQDWTALYSDPDRKGKTVNIQVVQGDQFTVQVNTGALLTSDLVGDMVLTLAKTLTELPR